ncbi:MAG TPA: hypothetical protein VK893_01565, partial [Pyrinomonadaceae bacterium]|nr:hypothetical protein [Pyrinomonadaceae bacterium]
SSGIPFSFSMSRVMNLLATRRNEDTSTESHAFSLVVSGVRANLGDVFDHFCTLTYDATDYED